MKKFFFCILPFIAIWGGYLSLLFVPQFHYEYLGTLNSDITVVTSEIQSGNDFYYLFSYKFTYKDKYDQIRSSESIRINNTLKPIYSKGFSSISNKSWIVNQLKKGNVYAPGWTDLSLILTIVLSIALPLFFLLVNTSHINCVKIGNNYSCGIDSYCFGCPFCVTDQRTISNAKENLNKLKPGIKQFFGY